jgi:hypothetical protein
VADVKVQTWPEKEGGRMPVIPAALRELNGPAWRAGGVIIAAANSAATPGRNIEARRVVLEQRSLKMSECPRNCDRPSAMGRAIDNLSLAPSHINASDFHMFTI